MSFQNLDLSPSIIHATKILGFFQAFPIQKEVIPAILAGKDILGIAPTGSGKTASFVLPLLTLLESQKPERNKQIKVLVLVPSRELAVQTEAVFNSCAVYLKRNLKTLAIYGGAALHAQLSNLAEVEILVATPGRLLELITKNAVSIAHIQHLVIDEADKLFQTDFADEINKIIQLLPATKQVTLFSATLHHKIIQIQEQLAIQPYIVDIVKEQHKLAQITQSAFLVNPASKGPFLRSLIKQHSGSRILIFVSSQRSADNLLAKLKKNNIAAIAIHGNKSQSERADNLENFKLHKFNVLIATDLIGRGIHIDGLPMVINYELPRAPQDYIHRIGRTGRANENGKAITLLTEEDMHHFQIIQKKMGIQIQIEDLTAIESTLNSKRNN